MQKFWDLSQISEKVNNLKQHTVLYCIKINTQTKLKFIVIYLDILYIWWDPLWVMSHPSSNFCVITSALLV